MKFRLLGNWSYIFLMFFLASILASPLPAQTSSGTLRCQVNDPSGGVVQDATVLVTSATGETKAVQGNKDGVYEFKGLAPGKYTVKVIAKGFAAYEQQGVEISASQVQKLGISLQIEEEVQKITVSGEAPTVSVSAENNASSLVISGKELDSLSDDPDELSSELSALAGPAAGPNGGQIYIDGFTAGQLPPKSSILEIRVNQNPFSAEYDRLGYGRVEITTKPGASQFHGQGFVSGNTNAFNTRNPFANEEPTYHSQFYNGNIGGPINKKAAFFFSIFRRDLLDPNVVSAYVPSPESIAPAIVPGSELTQAQYSLAVLNPHMRMNVGPRVDYQLSSKNVLTARYQYWENNDTDDGIGQLSLPSQAINSHGSEQTLQVGDTQVISDRTVNQSRFQYLHDANYSAPVNLVINGSNNLIGPPVGCLLLAQPCQVSAAGAFTGGGSTQGISTYTEDHYELQNYTSINLGKNFLRFGGRLRDNNESTSSTSGFNGSFSFPTLSAYQITRQGLEAGWTDAQIRAAGGGATLFSINSGIPAASINYVDMGLYGEDDWRARPNMTLSLGLRFETQSGIHDHADLAPRVGLAWGLGRGKSPKTILRAGFGIFYDRFSQDSLLIAQRMNGFVQQSFTCDNPDFFPNLPALGSASGCQQGSNIEPLDPNLRTPYTIQGGAGLERQLTKNATISVTYLNSHGVHQIMTRDINAPLPGTYVYCPPGDSSCTPSAGVRPYPDYGGVTDVGNIYQFESAGIFNQNQVITNFNMRMGAKLNLFGYYTLGYANGNTTSPMDPYDVAEDYGRAGFDIRHRVFLGGTWTMPHGFAVSPMIVLNSGAPFNIYMPGMDLYGTANHNDRPALASPGASGSNIVVTRWGTFDTTPGASDTMIGPNYGTGPGQFTTNLRLSKTFGFGKKPERSSGGSGGGPGGMGGGGRGGPGGGGGFGGRGFGGGGGGFFGPGMASNARYSLTFSVNARNVFNNVNLSAPLGALGTNLFGRSNSLVGGFFSSAAANRRIDLQMSFNF